MKMHIISSLSFLVTFFLTSITFAGEWGIDVPHSMLHMDSASKKAFIDSTFHDKPYKVTELLKNDPKVTAVVGDRKNMGEKVPSIHNQKLLHTSRRGIVNDTKVNLRRGPSLKERIVLTIADKGTPVEVFGRQGDWFKVKVGSDEGWIYSTLLTLEREKPDSERKMEAPAIANEKNVASLEDHGTSRTTGGDITQVELTAADADSKVLTMVATIDIVEVDSKAKTKAILKDSTARSEGPEIKTDTENDLTTPKPHTLGIKDFIALVREKNERIKSNKLEWEISKEAVEKERAIFEPEFITSYQHEKNRKPNTAEEALSRQFLSVYDERNNTYDAAIEALVPIGSRLRLGYTMADLSNSISEQLFNLNHEYQTFLSVSFTQPLLKNGGVKTTMANIRMAEEDTDIAFQMYRQEVMLVVANAAAAYWDLYSAQEKLKARKESVHIAQRILRDNRERVRAGKMAESEVLEAEAGLALRKSLESAAKQDLVSAMNNARTFFSSSTKGEGTKIVATDRLEIEKIEPDFHESIQKTFKLRPEYLSSLKKIRRGNIQLAFAKNQIWPQLDLKGSYGLNGLDDSPRKSFDVARSYDFETWAIGVELRVTLGGGKKSRSELKAAKKRKEQALLELKAVEVAVTNAVHTAVRNVYSGREQVRHYANVVDLNKRLLKVELARLEAGKSNSRIVLEKEENHNRAKDAKLESLIQYKRSILGLEIAEGSLLLHHGIEVMEVKK